MQISPTKKSTNERVTGPGNGLLPLVAVIVLTALTWAGIWGLHKHWYQDPMNPIAPTQSAASPN